MDFTDQSHIFEHDSFTIRLRGGKRLVLGFNPQPSDVMALAWLDLAGTPRTSILAIKQAVLPGITRETRPVSRESRLQSIRDCFAF
jgi:hypothetical protein